MTRQCGRPATYPALSVKAPRQKLGKGPVLTAEETGELLRSIETESVVGLRDCALFGVMVFTFARISAACGMNVADIFHQRRLWERLHEKGGRNGSNEAAVDRAGNGRIVHAQAWHRRPRALLLYPR